MRAARSNNIHRLRSAGNKIFGFSADFFDSRFDRSGVEEFQELLGVTPSTSVGMRGLHQHCSLLSPTTLTSSLLSSSLLLVGPNLKFNLGFV